MTDSLFTRSLILGCTVSGFALIAHAQQATAPAPATDSSLQEIVVTAQKRATNIQTTSIAIRAVSGEELISQGVTDIQGLNRLAPDLGITTDTIFTKLALRGVTSETIAEGADAALTVNIDGEYINRPVALNASFFDLERIEVLKGPQGTLNGRNSTAGAINVITAKPTDQFEGFVSGSYGNYNAFTLQGALNVPLNDLIAVRIAGIHTQHDGYRDNEVDGGTGGHGDSNDVTGARATVAYKGEIITGFIQGEYINVDNSAPAQYGVQVTQNTQGVKAYPIPGGGIDYLPTQTTFNNLPTTAFPLGQTGYTQSNQAHIRAQLNADITDNIDLTYVGGYLDSRTAAYIPLNGYLPATFSANDPHEDAQDWSNELRVSYKGDDGLYLQAGGFYFHENQHVEDGIQLPAYGGAYVNYFYRPDFETESYAFFAQAEVPITDTIKVIGGFRYTQDSKNATYYNFGGFGFGVPTQGQILAGAGGAPSVCGTGKTNGSYSVLKQCYGPEGQENYLGSVEWTPYAGHMMYAKISTGYRAGGFDNLTQQVINGQTIGNFLPETITSYEIGSKNRFLDNRLEFNVAGFHYDYSNLQVETFVNDAVGAATLNAGQAAFNGIDSDLTYQFTPADRFTLTANYLDAKYTKFAAFETGLNGGEIPLNLAGNHPPQAPKWTIGVGLDHTFDFQTNGNIVASVYSRFKTDYYLASFNTAADKQTAYTQTDLSLTYHTADDKISLQAYVHNIENNIPITFADFTAGPGFNIYNFIFGAPRTFGMQGSYRF